MKNNYFHSDQIIDPYTKFLQMLLEFYMGHMLNNTIQDVLIRRARLKFNACWVPG
jgi:hypothetical protein